MDKKQLYIVMVVSVLMLVGILGYRWITGDSADEPSAGPKKTADTNTAEKQKSPRETPARRPAARLPNAPRGGASDPSAPGASDAKTGPRMRPARRPPARVKTAPGLDVAGVTDLGTLRRIYRAALDREQPKAAQRALRRWASLAADNEGLRRVAEAALDAHFFSDTEVSAPRLAAVIEPLSGRVRVTPQQGAFTRAYVEAAHRTLAAPQRPAASFSWQRAALAARSDAERSQATTWRCAVQVAQKRWAAARTACEQARQKGGDHRAHLLVARIALQQRPQALDDPIAKLERAQKLEPGFAAAARRLATLYQQRKKLREAYRALSTAAKALGEQERHQGALKLWQRAAKVQPERPQPWLAIARSREALGRTEKALAGYQRAAALDKGNVQTRLEIARLTQPKDLLGAIRVLERAAQIDPTHAEVKRRLAAAREKLAAKQPRKPPERLTRLDGKLLHLVFTSRGGTPRAVVLKKEKYRERNGGGDGDKRKVKLAKNLRDQVNLVRTWSSWWLPLRSTFAGSSFAFPKMYEPQDWERIRWDAKEKKWRLVKDGEAHAVRRGKQWILGYRWPVVYEGMAPPPVVIERRYAIDPDRSYAWNLELRATNRSSERQTIRLALRIPTVDTVTEDRSMFNPISLKKEAICMVDDEVYMRTLPSLFGESKGCLGCDASTCACRRTPADDKNFSGRVRWAGIDEMYFILAVANPDDKEAVCRLGGLKHGVLHTTVAFSERGIAHQGSFVSWSFKVYSGPKIQERLDAVRVGEVDPKLGEAVDYGFFWIIGRPMIFLMKKIHVVVGNWGIAIILLTLLIKLLTLPLTMKQMRSMKGMAKLKPEMDKLKEKHGDDKQRFQQEMWALYKAHKINPLGGCFPLLIQMPIYIAWYQALMVSVDLYQAPLFGWITDLTKPDVAFHVAGMGVPILPIFMGATMFLQQRMTPTTVDSAQQKMMMYMMPAMFTFFMLFLPSGLTLYILTNTLLTMIHQWYMNHAD